MRKTIIVDIDGTISRIGDKLKNEKRLSNREPFLLTIN